MDIFTIAGFAVITALLAITVKQYKPELATQVSLAGGLAMLLMVLSEVTGIMETIRELSRSGGLDERWVSLVFKTLGVGYVGQLSGQLCRDMGEGALAMKAELCTRIAIAAMVLPYVVQLVGILTGMVDGTQ